MRNTHGGEHPNDEVPADGGKSGRLVERDDPGAREAAKEEVNSLELEPKDAVRHGAAGNATGLNGGGDEGGDGVEGVSKGSGDDLVVGVGEG